MNAATVDLRPRPSLADPSAGAVPETGGGVRARERAIEKTVREASAVAIGTPRGNVDVDVSEWRGGLAVRIAAKLPVPDLDDLAAIRSATPVPERIRAVQSALADELERLTGREIRRVSFTVTGAIIPERRRVR